MRNIVTYGVIEGLEQALNNLSIIKGKLDDDWDNFDFLLKYIKEER